MTNVKTLVLITQSFPYGYTEPFLEEEILYTAQIFDRVIVVPLSKDSSRLRHVPDNVIVDISLAKQLIFSLNTRVHSAIKTLIDNLLYAEFDHIGSKLLNPSYFRRFLGTMFRIHMVKNWLPFFINRFQIDITNSLFYSYWLDPQILGIAHWKNKYSALKIVSRAHGKDVYAQRHTPPYIALQWKLVEVVDNLFLISEHGYQHMVEAFPEHGNKYRIYRLGISNNYPRNELSISGFNLTSCSFIVEVKRLELLVEALVSLGKQYPSQNLHWFHIGDGTLREEIQELAQNSLPDNIHFTFVGKLSNQEVFEFYMNQSVDLFVNVSRSEGLPVSIMEAQSFGIPVMATAVGGTPEIVDSSNGILLNANPTANEIAQELFNFIQLTNESKLEKRRASYASWEQNFKADKNYGQFADKLKAIINRD